MAYVKTTLANGDVIDATKLNNLEDGVAANDEAAAPYELTITVDGDSGEITINDKTAAELFAMCSTGRLFKLTVSGVTIIVSIAAQEVAGDCNFAMMTPDGTIIKTNYLTGTDSVVFAASSS